MGWTTIWSLEKKRDLKRHNKNIKPESPILQLGEDKSHLKIFKQLKRSLMYASPHLNVPKGTMGSPLGLIKFPAMINIMEPRNDSNQ